MPTPTNSEFEYMPAPNRLQLLTRTTPFDPAVLASAGLDVSSLIAAELKGSELIGLVTSYLASDKCQNTKSFELGIGSGKRGKGGCCDISDDGEGIEVYRNSSKSLGLGVFEINFHDEKIHALHQTIGEVVGTDCGATLMKSLVLLAKDIQLISAFCDELIAEADKPEPFKFTVYRFEVQHQYWRKSEVVEARPIESVVLPAAMKSRLVGDLSDFLSSGTKKWYAEHGIPYKRSFLLHGTPGAGKTSLIQALAGKFKRNVCYLSPSHPDFTDDGLKAAVQRVPTDSIIVLEDVDGIAAAHRVKKDGDKSALTFSGMLNALDGVGGQRGQIFILTTNHRENLDAALIRNGRVDLHVEFTDATEEQMVGLFKSFYAHAEDSLATAFAKRLQKQLGEGRTISMAALQHYFIQQRKATAEEASKQVEKIIEEMEAMGKGKKGKEGEEKGKGAESKGEEKGKEGDESAGQKKKKKKAGEEGEEGESDDQEDADAVDDAPGKSSKKGKGGKHVKNVHVHIH